MPRKTKEQKELENKKKEPKKATKTPRKTASKKASITNQKTATKTTPTKKAATKKTASKKASNTKSNTISKKKTTTKKNNVAKNSTATTKKTTKKKVEILEYYDLPYRYNQTVVKVLAQTPTTLFIYWDISDADRKKFKKQYGENFFETTKPVLIIYNDTLNYHFEVEINDFANSWYLHVSDSKCDYRIELGRRPIVKNTPEDTDYIYISTSNEIESPNDRILFDQNQKMVYFRDVKTGIQTEKPIHTISFMRNIGKIYDIYDLYKEIYQAENIEGIYDKSNPSS